MTGNRQSIQQYNMIIIKQTDDQKIKSSCPTGGFQMLNENICGRSVLLPLM